MSNFHHFVFLVALLSTEVVSTFSWASPKPNEKRQTSEVKEGPPLFMGVGEQRIIRFQTVIRFSMGAPLVKAIAPREFSNADSKPLVLRALAPGTTDLWVWKQDGSTEHRTIQVEKILPELISPSLKKGLSTLQETEVVFSGAGVILRGTVEKEGEASRIATLARSFPKEILDETQASPELQARGKSKLNQWLATSPYSNRLQIEERAEDLWVRGSLERPKETEAVVKKLRLLYPLVRTEIDALPDASPTVHFKVFLLEIKKSRYRSLGLNWPQTIEGAFHVTTTSILDGIGLDLAIQALEGAGSGRVLSSPELVVRAPGEAELFSGGELPIHVQTQYFSNVTWKSFGLMLKLKVTHSTSEKVRLEIATEVSHLDASLTQNKTPGLQANRMKTQIDAHYGSPLFLSGLLQEDAREAARGLPLLQNIPVLGKLFGSEDFLHERSELVAILLPSLQPPRAPLERIVRTTPRGAAPPPRNWISPEEERRLRASTEFPWNALR